MELATNPIWSEAVRTLEQKPEDARTEFEQHTYARLKELESLIAKGDQALRQLREQAMLAEQQLTKACGAYENVSDMIAMYYVKKAGEEVRDEETDEADHDDGQQPDSDIDTNDS